MKTHGFSFFAIGTILILGLSGCVSDEEPVETIDATPTAATAPSERTSVKQEEAPEPPTLTWGSADRIMLVEVESAEASAYGSCVIPIGAYPTIELSREEEPGRVLPGATHIAVHVSSPVAAVGTQFGYTFESATITWFEPVFASEAQGARDLEIPVSAEQAEPTLSSLRWKFYWRTSYPVDADQCYTGATFASPDIVVEAVRG